MKTQIALLFSACLLGSVARGQAAGPHDHGTAIDPGTAEGKALAALPPYQPAASVNGTIRLWTRPARFFGPLMKAWESGFRGFQPGAKFEFGMYGTASGVGGLYEGAADIAVLGEEINPLGVAAFERVRHRPPFVVEVATCAYDVKNFGAANVIFVNRDNPLAQLTLAQLDGILGSEHLRGGQNIRTWGQLGLQGQWADREIHPYTWLLAESFCLYLSHAVLEGSHEWNPAIQEFVTGTKPDGTPYPDGEQILDHVSADPDAIGVSSVTFLKPSHHVKAIALAVDGNGPYVQASRATLISREYPLTRIVPAVIDRPAGQPVDPKLKEFLRYVLSRDGQEVLVRTHGYLPLDPEAAAAQLKRLE